MKRNFCLLVLSAACVLSASVASANPPFGSPCGQGVPFDSYGRGAQDGFENTSVGAQSLDQVCYSWGLKLGQTTRAQDQSEECTEAFKRGFEKGYELTSDEDPADGECETVGVQAGFAAFEIDVREGRASEECQQAYTQGAQDRQDNVGPNTYDVEGKVAKHCYEQGYYGY